MIAKPPPADVRGNDWRTLAVEPVDAFRPTLAATIVIPYYEAPEALELTLAGLERQTYPRDLFEVVIVDDGSRPPLETPSETPLSLRVMHQEDRGFGAARARNKGARAASGDILLFLDCDMVPEAGWLATHARWHHAASDVLTLGFRTHLDLADIGAEAVRGHAGSLADLFAGRPTEAPQWIEDRMARTDSLTSDDELIFRVVTSGNLGVSAAFFHTVGGFDESFNQWGAEDIEFGYRAYVRGAVLVPDRGALCWHQGPGARISDEERLSLAQIEGKLEHLIPHGRPSGATAGRSFTVPRFAVTVTSGREDQSEILDTVQQVLASRVRDLVVWVEEESDGCLGWLRGRLEPDTRVCFGPPGGAAPAFGATRFHITVPAGATVGPFMVGRLHNRLGSADSAYGLLASGHRVTITRSRALHRALRCRVPVDDIGTVIDVGGRDIDGDKPAPEPEPQPAPPPRLARIRTGLATLYRYARSVGARTVRVRTPSDAWELFRWLAAAVRKRVSAPSEPPPPAGTPRSLMARYPLGAELVAVGPIASAVFAASARVGTPSSDRHIDLLIVDTPDARRALNGTSGDARTVPAVAVLSELHPRLAVPAFDPEVTNPVDWSPDHEQAAAALDTRWQPTTAEVPAPELIRELRRLHHVTDSGAGSLDATGRAGALAALAAAGVLVHITDDDPALEERLGTELYGIMARDDVARAGSHRREQISVAIRRLALRDHSMRARARQLLEIHGFGAPPPEVSVLLATRRPDLLAGALKAVRAQTYPRIELVLALHGDGFGADSEIAALTSTIDCETRVVRVDADRPLGAVLNAAVTASSGTLLTKFDDDDYYAPDHLWDLVLAREYSKATLVAKAAEYVYLSQRDQTVRVDKMRERYVPHPVVSGGVLLISRQDLETAGGWRRVPRSVDISLARDVAQVGGNIYWTHGAGYLRVRHGDEHTWTIDDSFFLGRSNDMRPGRDFAFAGF